MGKKKDGKAKVGGATGARLPKRIGGVKLPKELRRAGGAVLEKASSPQGRELIAAGLGIAAAAIGAGAAKARPAGPGGDQAAGATRPGAAPSTPSDPHDIGVALGKIAVAALGGMFGRGKP